MEWRNGTSVRAAPGFVEPCLPTVAKRAPSGPDWVYELKHDGYRLLVRKQENRVRISSRRGADFTDRFPRVTQAIRRLKVRSLLLDGDDIVYDAKGMPNFALIHSKQYDREVNLVAFDLIELDGQAIANSPCLSERRDCKSSWPRSAMA